MKEIKVKKSIDFTRKNTRLLDEYIDGEQGRVSYNYVVNKLVSTFVLINSDIKLLLLDVCKKELEKFNNEITDMNSYKGMEKEEIRKKYIELIDFFSDSEVLEDNNNRRINILNGYVQVPKEWIVINEDMDKKSKHVGIIEAVLSEV